MNGFLFCVENLSQHLTFQVREKLEREDAAVGVGFELFKATTAFVCISVFIVIFVYLFLMATMPT